MVYAISDIHGKLDKFILMLAKIDFKPVDTMYILGDVIDRGKHGVAILLYIMEHSNMKMLKGNHESMLERSFLDSGRFVDKNSDDFISWMGNGGKKTYHSLMYKYTQAIRRKVYYFIEGLPVVFDNVEVNNKTFYLVHGCPLVINKEVYTARCKEIEYLYGGSGELNLPSYEYHLMWERVKYNDVFFKNKTVIFGHTPTVEYQNGIPLDIWYGNNVIGIDCGCGHSAKGARLACLCLDTMEEFYID